MKSLISTLTLTLSVLFLFGQPNDTFKISFKFSIAESILNIDPETETDPVKKELAATALMAMMFQNEEKPIAQAWVNNDFLRVNQSLLDDSYQITNKNTGDSYNVYPSTKQYTTTVAASDKLIAFGDAYFEVSDLPIEYIENATKDILGYTCKLAKIKFEAEDQDIELEIWYTEDLPKLYWGEYAYLETLPGAALQITTMGIGIEASEIIKDNDKTIFEIADDYELIESFYEDMETSSENYPYEVAENTYAFLDTALGLYGLMDAEENTIVEPSFALIDIFYNGHAIVVDEEYMHGTIDLQGNPVLPMVYNVLQYDEESEMYLFAKDDFYGMMDKDGKVIIPNKYQILSFFREGYAIFHEGGLEGIIDKNERVVVPPSHNSILSVVNNHFITLEDDHYSLYEMKTNKKVFGGYDYLSTSGEPSLLIAYKNEQYGFVDFQGKEVIPLKYIYVSVFQNGISNVMDSEQNEFYVNTKGDKVEQ